MFVLKMPLLVDLQQKVDEFVPSITSRPSTVILENTLHWCMEKCCYGNFKHRYNVSPFHFCARGILLRWSTCARTAYDVVRNCRNFEKH
jgi:hypothetical protein